jgi:DNA-binding GntR family transcriptional regulator
MRSTAETVSLSAEAYEVVRDRIARGELVLGQAISRRDLAAELGMSFLPVTEALLRLEFEGLIESRPRAGTRVRVPTREDVEGNYIVRQALETQAAILCSHAATPAERSELRHLAARVDALATKSDRSIYVKVHLTLHRRIAECARCEALCDVIDKTHAMALIWFCAVRRPLAGPEHTRRHQQLMDAILTGEEGDIIAAVRDHLAVGRRHTLELLEPYFRVHGAAASRFVRTRTPSRNHA